MRLDPRAIARALGAGAEPVIHTQLCRSQLDRYQAALATGEPLLVACTQEAPLFAEVAGETAEPVLFANIRERAGWSDEGDRSSAEDRGPAGRGRGCHPAGTGPDPALGGPLPRLRRGRDRTRGGEGSWRTGSRSHSCFLPAPTASRRRSAPSRSSAAACAGSPAISGPSGRGSGAGLAGSFFARSGCASWPDAGARRARGGSDARSLRRHAFVPRAREARRLSPARPAATPPPWPARPVRGHRPRRRVREAALRRTSTAELCAHSRSRRTGCTRCLDLCPTGAITPAGDHVAIDPYVCAGCGACAGVCPTGAAAYASPGRERPAPAPAARCSPPTARAGGEAPVLLIHEARHGGELIAPCRPPRPRPAGPRPAVRGRRACPARASSSWPAPSPMARLKSCCLGACRERLTR